MTHTLEMLADEQTQIALKAFDYDFVWKLGSQMRKLATEKRAPVAITISHGLDPAFVLLMPGATADNLAWAARKRAVAWRFQRSSLAMRLEAKKGKFDLNIGFRLPVEDFVASGGGIPLVLQSGAMIGTAAVSGLPDVDDHELVVAALKASI